MSPFVGLVFAAWPQPELVVGCEVQVAAGGGGGPASLWGGPASAVDVPVAVEVGLPVAVPVAVAVAVAVPVAVPVDVVVEIGCGGPEPASVLFRGDPEGMPASVPLHATTAATTPPSATNERRRADSKGELKILQDSSPSPRRHAPRETLETQK
jgi:hypothetical protein